MIFYKSIFDVQQTKSNLNLSTTDYVNNKYMQSQMKLPCYDDPPQYTTAAASRQVARRVETGHTSWRISGSQHNMSEIVTELARFQIIQYKMQD